MTKYDETKIEITLRPHMWDNKENPYFWVILGYINGGWCNTGYCGWEKSPTLAWEKAFEESKKI